MKVSPSTLLSRTPKKVGGWSLFPSKSMKISTLFFVSIESDYMEHELLKDASLKQFFRTISRTKSGECKAVAGIIPRSNHQATDTSLLAGFPEAARRIMGCLNECPSKSPNQLISDGSVLSQDIRGPRQPMLGFKDGLDLPNGKGFERVAIAEGVVVPTSYY